MVVIINGQPTSGKSTFVHLCQQVHSPYTVYEYSTIDFVKSIATECGWDGTKTPKNREFLSNLKDILTKWDDVPFKKSLDQIKNIYDFGWFSVRRKKQETLIFIHCREPEEIQRFKDELGDDCVSLLIRRPTVENNNQSNHADANVFYCKYDYEIMNNDSLEQLEEKAKNFLMELVEKYGNSNNTSV